MLDKLYQYFVPHRKNRMTDVAIAAASILLGQMRLLWKGQQSLTPQKAYVRIQEGRGHQKTSRYKSDPWL